MNERRIPTSLLLALTVTLGIHVTTITAQNRPVIKTISSIGLKFGAGYWWMSFVAFSPNGTMVASDGANPVAAKQSKEGIGIVPVSFWSFPSGEFLRVLTHQPIAFSRDWKMMATTDAILDLVTETEIAKPKFRPPLNKMAGAVFSADGSYLVVQPYTTAKISKTSRFKAIAVIRTSDGAVISEFGTRATFSIAISPDGKTVASGHWDNVTLWDTFTGERKALLRGFGRYVMGIEFSPDGRLLVAGDDTGHVEIWNTSDRTLKYRIETSGYSYVSTPAFSPDGQLVTVGTYGNGTMVTIDTETGRVVSEIRVSDIGCGSVAFSPDGQYLIAPTNQQLGPKYGPGGMIRVFKVGLAAGAP